MLLYIAMSGEHRFFFENLILGELEKLRIQLPKKPDPSRKSPRPWLIRGENDEKKIIHNLYLQPKSGAWGTQGIFFGDCQQPLMFPNPGIYYVFSANIGGIWINTNSDQFKIMCDQIAQKNSINPKTIDGGVQIIEEIYSKHNLYSPDTGIATIHNPLPIDQSIVIIVIGKLFTQSIRDGNVKKTIMDKIIFVD